MNVKRGYLYELIGIKKIIMQLYEKCFDSKFVSLDETDYFLEK